METAVLAHLRLPTSKQGGGSVSCSSAAQAVGLAPGSWPACNSLQSTFSSTQPPVLPASSTPGTQALSQHWSPAEVGQTAHCSDSSLTPSALHLSCAEPSGSSVTHFFPKSSHLCSSFLSMSPAHHCSPLQPCLPAELQHLPCPERADLLPGHHPDCCLQGSRSWKTGYISYKLVASTLGVYILGPIQHVMQGNHNLKRHTQPSVHCSAEHNSQDTEVT